MDRPALAERIRAFNRLYTQAIGTLDDRHEGLDLTLAQSRLLFTIGSLTEPQVNQIADRVGLDLAYTSRLLGTLEDAKLIRRTISTQDRRQRVVVLTPAGRRLLGEIERRSNKRALTLIEHLDPDEIDRLLDAMDTIGDLLTRQESDDSAEPTLPA